MADRVASRLADKVDLPFSPGVEVQFYYSTLSVFAFHIGVSGCDSMLCCELDCGEGHSGLHAVSRVT